MNSGFSLANSKDLEDSQEMKNQDSFSSISDLSEHGFGISGQNVARIS